MSELTKKIQLEERISGDWSQAGMVDVFYFVLPPFACTYNQFKIFQSDLEIKYSIKGMNTSEEFLEKTTYVKNLNMWDIGNTAVWNTFIWHSQMISSKESNMYDWNIEGSGKTVIVAVICCLEGNVKSSKYLLIRCRYKMLFRRKRLRKVQDVAHINDKGKFVPDNLESIT